MASRRLLTLRRVIIIFVTLIIVEYLVLPQLAGAGKSLSLLKRINLGYLGLGIALEAAALVAYAQLTRAVLPRTNLPKLWTVLRVNLSTLAVSHIVPGGTIGGSALGYRLLTQIGVSGTDAGFALAAQGIGSAVVLNVILWIGLVISIPLRGYNPLYLTAAIIGSIVIGAFLGLVVLLTKGEQRAAKIMSAIARRVPFLNESSVHKGVHRITEHLRALLADRALLYRAGGWAAANWMLDAASLWVFLGAFGHFVSPDGLLISFGLANVLAAIPVTPGGLGVVEAVLTPTLVGFGTPKGVAILGVIAYRLFNFWIPIPVGGGAYLSLKAQRPTLKEAAKEIHQLGTQSLEEAERPRDWAARHGMNVRR
ncbi:MAG: YbhN family protein [Actinomycetota bacterium]